MEHAQYTAEVRPEIHTMTDREIAEETLLLMRQFADGLSKLLPVVEEFGRNPMGMLMGQKG